MLLGHSKGNKDVSSGLGSVIVVKPRVVAARLRTEGVVVLKLQKKLNTDTKTKTKDLKGQELKKHS